MPPLLEGGAERLRVVEHFHSLQGEGVHAGRSALFIRLAGCNVRCSWCDTKHSWAAAAHPLCSVEQLVAAVRESSPSMVVITGGEPLEQNLDRLCTALVSLNVPRHLETSGVEPLSGAFEWITLSPKRHRQPRRQLLACCHELKVVVHEHEDLHFAHTMAAACQAAGGNRPHLCLQPGEGSAAAAELATNHVLKHRQWRLSLQTHKWLGLR